MGMLFLRFIYFVFMSVLPSCMEAHCNVLSANERQRSMLDPWIWNCHEDAGKLTEVLWASSHHPQLPSPCFNHGERYIFKYCDQENYSRYKEEAKSFLISHAYHLEGCDSTQVYTLE